MRRNSFLIEKFGLVTLVVVLSSCASTRNAALALNPAHSQDRKVNGVTNNRSHAHHMENMNMQQMCELHTQMMSGKSPEGRKAMIEAHQGEISPKMMQKHMEMMETRCSSTK